MSLITSPQYEYEIAAVSSNSYGAYRKDIQATKTPTSVKKNIAEVVEGSGVAFASSTTLYKLEREEDLGTALTSEAHKDAISSRDEIVGKLISYWYKAVASMGFQDSSNYSQSSAFKRENLIPLFSSSFGKFASSGFVAYLGELITTPGFTNGAVILHTGRLLQSLSEQLNLPSVPDPQALPGEDNSLALAWQIGSSQFSIDVFPNGCIDWFWRNKVTKEFEGEEGKVVWPLPERLIQHFGDAFSDG